MNTRRRAGKPPTAAAQSPQQVVPKSPRPDHVVDVRAATDLAQAAAIPQTNKRQKQMKQIIKCEEHDSFNSEIARDGPAPFIAAAAAAEQSAVATCSQIPCNVKQMIRDAVYHSAGATAVGGLLPCALNPQVNVQGIGELRFPLSEQTLQSLSAMMKQVTDGSCYHCHPMSISCCFTGCSLPQPPACHAAGRRRSVLHHQFTMERAMFASNNPQRLQQSWCQRQFLGHAPPAYPCSRPYCLIVFQALSRALIRCCATTPTYMPLRSMRTRPLTSIVQRSMVSF